MKILVAYKWAADPQEAQIAADGSVDLSRARSAISDYDEVAIEVAVQVAGDGDEAVGATVGGPQVGIPMALKSALSRGLDRTVVLGADALQDAGTSATALALAGVVEHVGEVDLVLTGDCSIDVGARMVPAVLAGLLGWPAITDVTAIRRESGGALEVERAVPGGFEVLALTTPAVLAVATDAAVPKVPGMKDILAAGRKPSEKLDLTDVGLTPERVTGLAGTLLRRTPAERAARAGTVIDTTDPAAAAAELVTTLRDAGVW